MSDMDAKEHRVAVAIHVPLSVLILVLLTFVDADLKSRAAGVVYVVLSLLLLTRFRRVFPPSFALLLGSVSLWMNIVLGDWLWVGLAVLIVLYGIHGLYALLKSARNTEAVG